MNVLRVVAITLLNFIWPYYLYFIHISEIIEKLISFSSSWIALRLLNSMLKWCSSLFDIAFILLFLLQNMDISGCPQVKLAIILLSILPSSYSMDPMLRKSVKQSPFNFERFDEDKFQISLGLWPIMSFKAVQEVNISNCPMLHLEAAIECFCKSFPSLRTLKAAYFLKFRMKKLRWLVQRCPLLCNIDLTVDTSPLIATRVSILSSSETRTRLSVLPFNIYNFPSVTTLSSMPRPLQSHITRLTLEGRTDISGKVTVADP